MARTLLKRLLVALLSLWLAVTLVFFLLRLLPGDALTTQLRVSGAPETVIAERRAALGLDAPLGEQYGRYIVALAGGDLGVSLLNGQPVSMLIGSQITATLELAAAALLVSIVFGVALGISYRQRVAMVISTFALSAPVYWTGTLAVYFFSAQLDMLPSGGAGRPSQLILPALVLGLALAGGLAQVVARSISDAAAMPHVAAARAKGLPPLQLGWQHIFRLTLPLLIAHIGVQTAFLASGAVVTETLFSRPGVGRLLLDAVLRQDYPLVQGIVIWSALVVIGAGVLTDAINALIDPRFREQS
jgi:peptide/nickel transport system permease protein